MTEESQKETKKATKITIELNTKWCKRCGICIAYCPKGVFEADKTGLPIIAHPEKCGGCDLCAMLCPDFGIFIVREEDTAAD